MDLGTLVKLESVYNAGYLADDYNKCLHGTWESFFQDIMLCTRDPQDRSVFWLNGLASTGKSTQVQSLVAMLLKWDCLVLAFSVPGITSTGELNFFFQPLPTSSHSSIPTLKVIVSVINKGPTLVYSSLNSQLENLINPLSRAKISHVIVDALEEWIDN